MLFVLEVEKKKKKRNLDLFQGLQSFGLFLTKNMSNINGSGRFESSSFL